MTDNEIIKALECCINDDCNICPETFGNCELTVMRNALDLIKRQQAENERLEYSAKEWEKQAKYFFTKMQAITKENIKEFVERAGKELEKIPQHHFCLLAVEETMKKVKEEMTGVE